MIVTERDCEIVKRLIALYCTDDPERIDISVEECLDLFAKMVLASWQETRVTTPPALRATSPCTGEALVGAERERPGRQVRPMTLPAAA